MCAYHPPPLLAEESNIGSVTLEPGAGTFSKRVPGFFLPPGLASEPLITVAPEAHFLEGLAAELRAQGSKELTAIPLLERWAAWNRAIELLLDPSTAERQQLVRQILTGSGLSAAGLSEGLEVILGGLRGSAASQLYQAARARIGGAPHRLVGVQLASNLPGLAAQVLLPALLAGAPLLLRTSRREPHFAPLLLELLAREIPAVRRAFACVCFDPTRKDLLQACWGSADRVLAFGDEPSLAGLSSVVGDRLVAFGPKLSLACVSEPFDPLTLARLLARDIVLLDQRGCLSIQAIYCEGTAERALELAEALAWALQLEALRLPPGPAEPGRWIALQQLRKAAALAGKWVSPTPASSGTVLMELELGLQPSPGLRTVRIYPVADLELLGRVLEPWAGKLQGAVLHGEGACRLRPDLERLGVSRFCAAGNLQRTDASWANGGIDPLSLFA